MEGLHRLCKRYHLGCYIQSKDSEAVLYCSPQPSRMTSRWHALQHVVQENLRFNPHAVLDKQGRTRRYAQDTCTAYETQITNDCDVLLQQENACCLIIIENPLSNGALAIWETENGVTQMGAQAQKAYDFATAATDAYVKKKEQKKRPLLEQRDDGVVAVSSALPKKLLRCAETQWRRVPSDADTTQEAILFTNAQRSLKRNDVEHTLRTWADDMKQNKKPKIIRFVELGAPKKDKEEQNDNIK